MVQEFRRIMLDEKELISAMESYRRMVPLFLPEGKIIKCSAATDGPELVHATLEVTEKDAMRHESHIVKDADIAKCLVRFCLESNIMLPKDGRKTIAVVGDYVSLCIALDFTVDLPEHISALSPQNIHHIKPGDIVRGKHVVKIRS